MSLNARCAAIRLMLSDVDGVLTDGGITFDDRGVEIKTFNIRDGLGIKLWQVAGNEFGIVTGRASRALELRAGELGITILRQKIDDKWAAVREILANTKLAPENVCYLGDDLPDLPVIKNVGLGVAVADAAEEVRRAAAYVTSLPGGMGAVRETVEMILKSQRKWVGLIEKYVVV